MWYEANMETEEISTPKLIYKLLGGKEFFGIIGAKHVIEGVRTLSFKVKKNPKDVSHVHVIREFPELYDVEFLKAGNNGIETLEEAFNVVPDALRRTVAGGIGYKIFIEPTYGMDGKFSMAQFGQNEFLRNSRLFNR
jgi:hypothetical protein